MIRLRGTDGVGGDCARFRQTTQHGWLLAFVLAACDSTNGSAGPPPPVAVPNTPPTIAVDLGTGEATFEPLEDGSSVTPVYGPQGGSHIWTSVRVRDPGVTDAYVNLSTRLEDGRAAGTPSSVAVRLVAAPNGTVQVIGLRNFLAAKEPSGTPLVLRAEVIGTDGRHGASERHVVLGP